LIDAALEGSTRIDIEGYDLACHVVKSYVVVLRMEFVSDGLT
jgi:hypothetical protein